MWLQRSHHCTLDIAKAKSSHILGKGRTSHGRSDDMSLVVANSILNKVMLCLSLVSEDNL